MGTTQNTTGSNTSNLTFNPAAQNIYNQLTGSGGSVLSGYMNNPFGNPMYQMGASQSQKGAQQAGSNNIQALLQNMLTGGIGGQAGQGFQTAQMAQTGRANQAISSQANISNVMSALQRQMAATGMGMSFSPQLTGQTGNFSQTQSTGGLGSWLPQLLGAGLKMGTAAMTAGAGGGLGGSFADASAGAPSMMSSMFSPSTFSGLTGMSMPGGGGGPLNLNPGVNINGMSNPFGSN